MLIAHSSFYKAPECESNFKKNIFPHFFRGEEENDNI